MKRIRYLKTYIFKGYLNKAIILLILSLLKVYKRSILN